MIEMNLVSLIINIGPGEHRVPVGLSKKGPRTTWRMYLIVLLSIARQRSGLCFRGVPAGCWRGLCREIQEVESIVEEGWLGQQGKLNRDTQSGAVTAPVAKV